MADVQIPDISFDKCEIGVPQKWFNIAVVACRKIIKANHSISFSKQGLAKIGTNEPGSSRH
jgi:hypothetical protein